LSLNLIRIGGLFVIGQGYYGGLSVFVKILLALTEKLVNSLCLVVA